jgi:carboxylesterase type B
MDQFWSAACGTGNLSSHTAIGRNQLRGHDTGTERAAADPKGARFRLVKQTLGAWAAFARTGNPSNSGLQRLRPYTLSGRETMALDATSELQVDSRREERIFIESALRA